MQTIDSNAVAAVWSHDIADKGQTLTFPKHAGVELYGVVLKGSVAVKGEEAKTSTNVGKWVAFRAPGAGLSVSANEPHSRVYFAVVGADVPIAEVVVKLRGKDAKSLAWKTRPQPIETVDLAASRDLVWAGGAMHARIGFEGPSKKASLGVLIASKDAPVAKHAHADSSEILAALRADGTVQRAPTSAATELAPFKVTDGVVTAIPKGVQHAWEPGNTKPLIALQLYVPGGPEQRFKKLAEDAAAAKP
jgi:mannose-6-phosphate isomerase-like protein (cupin superfamily)